MPRHQTVSPGPITKFVVVISWSWRARSFKYLVSAVFGLGLTDLLRLVRGRRTSRSTRIRTTFICSSSVPWRQNEIAYSKAFPDQDSDQIIVVVDGQTPELADSRRFAALYRQARRITRTCSRTVLHARWRSVLRQERTSVPSRRDEVQEADRRPAKSHDPFFRHHRRPTPSLAGRVRWLRVHLAKGVARASREHSGAIRSADRLDEHRDLENDPRRQTGIFLLAELARQWRKALERPSTCASSSRSHRFSIIQRSSPVRSSDQISSSKTAARTSTSIPATGVNVRITGQVPDLGRRIRDGRGRVRGQRGDHRRSWSS